MMYNKIPDCVNKLNNAKPTIDVAFECESNKTLPFLDTIPFRPNNDLQLEVCRKSTKNDLALFISTTITG